MKLIHPITTKMEKGMMKKIAFRQRFLNDNENDKGIVKISKKGVLLLTNLWTNKLEIFQ